MPSLSVLCETSLPLSRCPVQRDRTRCSECLCFRLLGGLGDVCWPLWFLVTFPSSVCFSAPCAAVPTETVFWLLSRVWMTSFVSTPAFRPGLVQSSPGQNVNALLLEVHGHRKFDLSLPARVLQCGPLESIRQEKCVQLKLCLWFLQPFSLLLI